MEMEREGNVLVKFRCESCGKKIGVPEKYAGKKARCPGCQKTITIPVQTMISSPAVAESALSQPRGNAYVSPTAGLKELEMTCLRDDLLYEYTYVEKATDMIASEGADAAKGLANLVWELLACRSPKIENALTACTKAAPLPELLEAIAAVARAPSLTSPPGNARFLPQIAGGGKIGWDDGMASRIRKYAREVFASVKERIKGG
jgi:DNA-directed RNA polymerase subunit RPC12/RpoP